MQLRIHDEPMADDTIGVNHASKPHMQNTKQLLHRHTASLYVLSHSFTYQRESDRDVFEDSMVEAKAKATKFCPRGVLEVEASPRGPPTLGFLPRDATQRAVMPRRQSVHHSQIQRPTAGYCRLLCLCMKYCVVYGIESFRVLYFESGSVAQW